METIYKYPLKLTGEQTIEMPRGAEILSVQDQGGTICVWALVDTKSETKQYTFRIYGTGHELPEQCGMFERMIYAHVGSVQQDGFVWHVFMDV
jgi:hypothetical protein